GIALCAYRAVQEGLTNAMRYAHGSRVEVDVSSEPGTLHVRIHDSGGTATAEQLGTGTGLVGLRERVLLCGGRLSAGPDETGYTLAVTLPTTDRGLPGEPTLTAAEEPP